MSPVPVLLIGVGRLGGAIVSEAASTGVRLSAACARRSGSHAGVPLVAKVSELLAAAPGAPVIDAAPGEGAADRITAVARAGHPLVEAGTGLDEPARQALEEAAKTVAVVVAPNTSPGLTLLKRALQSILPALPEDWDAAVLDRHHRHKRDAPSGTARALRDLLAGARGEDGVSVQAFRHGEVVGEHTVFLSGEHEELQLVHRVFDRALFARGALAAARFAAAQPPGRYSMDDVLGLPPA